MNPGCISPVYLKRILAELARLVHLVLHFPPSTDIDWPWRLVYLVTVEAMVEAALENGVSVSHQGGSGPQILNAHAPLSM